MRLGILGAGALGLTFAAALARAHDVVVLARDPALAARLEGHGIAVSGDEIERPVDVRASADPVALRDREAVLVAVKAFATTAALAPLRDVLPAGALVASVQNGLDFVSDARRALPNARLVAGSTSQGAILVAPGRVRPIGRGATVFGRDAGGAPSSEDLAAALRAAGLAASVTDDVDGLLWRKLVVNAAINPLGALAGRPNGAIAEDPDLASLARGLAAEAAAVAAAEGVDVGDPWALVEAASQRTAANRSSMLQDLDAGRPTEIDAIGGAILRRAAAHGIATPLTAATTALVRARERAR